MRTQSCRIRRSSSAGIFSFGASGLLPPEHRQVYQVLTAVRGNDDLGELRAAVAYLDCAIGMKGRAGIYLPACTITIAIVVPSTMSQLFPQQAQRGTQ
jgi:hypothetical protein